MGLLLGLTGSLQAKDWETLTGCTLIPGVFNDGDSFHVSYKGKTYVFRLYYVDAPEVENQFPDRVAAQARYLRITPEEALKVGAFAAAFTEKVLSKSFTVVTCWQDARGQTSLGRSFAFVLPSGAKIEDIGKTDLAALLIGNGLVRLYGAAGGPSVSGAPSGPQIEGRLAALEQHARADKYGAYTPQLSSGIKTGPMNGVDFSAAEEASAEDKIANVSPDIPISMGGTVIEGSKASFNGYSEIPGWKPKTGATPPPQEEKPSRINLNAASAEELEAIPEISPELAAAIVKNRPYTGVEELLRLPDVSKAMLNAIRPEVTCGDVTPLRIEQEPPVDGRP